MLKMIKKLIEVDEELWKKLKIHCLKNETKLKDIMNVLIKDYLKQ